MHRIAILPRKCLAKIAATVPLLLFLTIGVAITVQTVQAGPGKQNRQSHSALTSSTQTASWTVYVPVGSLNEIVTFNSATDTLGNPITVGHGQRAVGLSPDDSVLYFTNQAGSFGYYNLINGTSNANIGFGGGSDPQAVAVAPNGVWAFVADYGGSKVVAFNAITKSIVQIATPSGPDSVAITPNNKEVLATIPSSNEVVVISTATNSIIGTISVTNPDAVAITPNGQTALVASYSGGFVVPIDLSTLSAGSSIPVGTNPDFIAVSPNGDLALVANAGSNSVTPIKLSTLATENPVTVGSAPSAIAFTPDGSSAFCVDSGSSGITPITVGTLTTRPSFSIGGPAYDIAIDPDQAPVASLSATLAAAGSPTTFDASGSTVKFGTIVKYDWNFGDGSTLVTSVPSASHTYLAAGSYYVTVTETDSAGTSTEQVFTGEDVVRNGSGSAVGAISIVLPGATTPGWQALVVNSSGSSVSPINL